MGKYRDYVDEIKIKNRILLFIIPIIFVASMFFIEIKFSFMLRAFSIIAFFTLKRIIPLELFFIISSFIAQIVMTLLLFFLIKKMLKLSLGKFKFLEIIKSYSLGAIFGILEITVVFFVIFLLNGVTVYFNQEISYLSLFFYLILFIFHGLKEELYFRGILPFLSKAIGSKFAVILSSTFLMLAHLRNPHISYLVLLNIFVAELMFSLIYIYTGNIWIVGAMHSFWNFFITNVYGTQVSGLEISNSILFSIPNLDKDLISGGLFGFEGSIVTLVIELAISLFVCYKIKSGKEEKCLQEQED